MTRTAASVLVGSGTHPERVAAVLDDLHPPLTLAPTSWRKRRQNTAFLFGARYRYKAILEGFELPEGWCMCPTSSEECLCREPRDPDKDVAIGLIGADPISHRDYRDIAGGDSYDVDLTPDPLPWQEWWSEAESMWMRAQMRVARRGSQVDDPLARTRRRVEARRRGRRWHSRFPTRPSPWTTQAGGVRAARSGDTGR